MTMCRRFEEEGLPLLEQGRTLDEHFDTCPDCREARRIYQRLQTELATVGARHQPPMDWQDRVWETIDHGQQSQAHGRRRWLLGSAGIAAAATILLMISPLREPAPIALEVTVEAGDGPVRRAADGASPGDRLMLRATTGDATHAELRIYRHDRELILACSTQPPCRRRGDTLEAMLILPSVGSYQPLLLVSDAPLPEPASDLDGDADDALDAGARLELGDPIDVR